MNLQPQLRQGLADISLRLEEAQEQQLLSYLALLEKWNKSFNLTAITAPHKMLSYHLLDSLVIHDKISDRANALDVGSGAGLPGIPLAIIKPQSTWVLLDSNGKKTRFMQQALALCGIKNAVVVKSRVEDYHASKSIDVIISRAYASISHFSRTVSHLLSPNTILMTMKTDISEQESRELDTNEFELQNFSLKVPGIAEPRSLVTLRQH